MNTHLRSCFEMYYTCRYNIDFHDGVIKQTKNRMTDTVNIVNNDLASNKIISKCCKMNFKTTEKVYKYLVKCLFEMGHP